MKRQKSATFAKESLNINKKKLTTKINLKLKVNVIILVNTKVLHIAHVL